MQFAIVLFDGITALDAVGPYEVLSRIPGADVRFVAPEPGAKRTDQGALAVVADHGLDDVPAPDVVLVPGGKGELELRGDARVLDWLRLAHETSRFTTSVCTGSLVLAAAGILRGRSATTHWTAMKELERLGARPVSQRIVEEGKIITAAGVSSGIDMALLLASRLTNDTVARAIQLSIEYDPQPPFDSGSPETAGPEIVELVRSRSRFAT